MMIQAPAFLGPPQQASLVKPAYVRWQDNVTCLVQDANGVVSHGPCNSASPVVAPVATVAPVVTVAPVAAQQVQVSWATLALIGLGIYLVTKG